jgi:hypothetical protein
MNDNAVFLENENKSFLGTDAVGWRMRTAMSELELQSDQPASGSLGLARMTLEALQARERAAQYHADAIELQMAMAEAESGNHSKLQRWFDQHPSLVETTLATQPTIQSDTTVAASASQLPSLPERLTASKAAPLPVAAETTTEIASPWAAMIVGAQRREEVRFATPDSVIESRSATVLPSDELPLIDDDLEDTPALVDQVESKPFEVEALPMVDLSVLTQPVKSDESSIRKWLWLSPSIMGSALAHVFLVIGMSFYAIQLARQTEPKAIVASAVDTQEISMDTPVEMPSVDVEQLDVSEPTTPNMPSFSSPTAESTSSVQLPTSMVGIGPVSDESTASDSVQEAVSNATFNNLAATNVAQFFGVKAAGNTFCFLVDASPSMKKDNAFAAAKSELVRSLSMFKPKQRFHIVFFGKDLQELSLDGKNPEAFPVYATPENLQAALRWLEQVRVQDDSKSPKDGLQRALGMDPDGVFFLFDGVTTVDIPAFLKQVNRSTDIISGESPLVPIHTLGFYNEEHQAIMQRIAKENLGTFRFIPKPNTAKK